jgi:hypothetical protein
MLPSSILEILISLTPGDFKKLGNFITSPYFNTNPAIVKLYAIIKKHHPAYSKNIFKHDEIFKKIYLGNEFKEQTIRNLYSEFGALLKKFIGYEELQFTVSDIEGYIGAGLSRRGLYSQSEKFIKKSISKNPEEFHFDSEMFFYFFRLGTASINNLGFLQEQRSSERLEAISSELERLTIFFLSESLNISIEMFEIFIYKPDERKNTVADEFLENVNMRKFIDYLENTGNKNAAFIKIRYLLYYYHVYEFTEHDYEELKSEIYKTIHFVKKVEQLSFITIIAHLIVKKLLPFNRKFSREIFEFAKLFQSLDIFSGNSTLKISVGLFRNFFTAANILREYEWIENFVKEFAPYLSDESRENEINYSMGILSFKQGKYEESLDYFNKFKMKDIGEKINTRYYIMMNYIELKAYESAFSVLHTIRQFYLDRDIPQVYSGLMEDSIKFFNEIIKAGEEGRKIDGHIYDEAHSDKRYFHKQYIYDKMELLK